MNNETSIKVFTLNFAPVILDVERTYCENYDLWTVKFSQYDYENIDKYINYYKVFIYDKKTKELDICKAVIEYADFDNTPHKLIRCIPNEVHTAVEYSKKYIKAMYKVEAD